MGFELFIHDEGINKSQSRVPERLRQATNDNKSVLLPKPDRTLVGSDHQVVLHRPKTYRYGLYLRKIGSCFFKADESKDKKR